MKWQIHFYNFQLDSMQDFKQATCLARQAVVTVRWSRKRPGTFSFRHEGFWPRSQHLAWKILAWMGVLLLITWQFKQKYQFIFQNMYFSFPFWKRMTIDWWTGFKFKFVFFVIWWAIVVIDHWKASQKGQNWKAIYQQSGRNLGYCPSWYILLEILRTALWDFLMT